jgi:hypothetical protein
VPNTRIVSPGRAASTAAWIESPGPTTVGRWACAPPGHARSANVAASETTRDLGDRGTVPPLTRLRLPPPRYRSEG